MRRRRLAPMLRASLALALFGLLSSSTRAAASTQLDADLEQLLADGRYAFCDDGEYVLSDADRVACHYARTSAVRCPALDRACQRPAPSSRRSPRSVETPASGSRGDARDGAVRAPRWQPQLSAEQWRWLQHVLAASVVLLLLSALWRLIRHSSRAPLASQARRDASASIPTRPSPLRLLDDAAALLDRGQCDDALTLTFCALVLELQRREWLRLSPARTSREYARDLAAQPGAQQLLASGGDTLEALQFGGQSVTAERARGYLHAVCRFVGCTTTALAGICLGLALGTLGCSSAPPHRAPATDPWASSSDAGPNGLSLLASLLEKQQRRVTHHLGPYETLLQHHGTLIIYEQSNIPPRAWPELQRWATGGNRLVVVGEGSGLSHFGFAAYPTSCPDFLPAGSSGLKLSPPPVALGPRTSHATITPACRYERFVAKPGGEVLVLPSVAMLTNAALVSADNARLLLQELGSGDVTFAGYLNDQAGAESPYHAVTNLRAGPWFIQLALLLLAWYLARGIPFGRPRHPPSIPRRDVLEHARALGATLSRARASAHVLNSYTQWGLEQLKAELGPGAPTSLPELATALAARTRIPKQEVIDLLERLQQARNRSPQTAYHADDLKLMDALQRLIIRSRRTAE